MYFLEKKMQISAAHHLPNYPGPCHKHHGHNWNVTVHCCCKDDELDEQGMVIDFSKIKKIVNQIDHANINEFVENPTAEHIAKWLCEQIPRCYLIEVEETDGNKINYWDESRREALWSYMNS